MLGKLIKNEFKATSRSFLPIYVIFILVAIFTKITYLIQNNFSQVSNMAVFSVIQGLLLFTFVISCCALVIGTAVIIVKRFYDNMLKDEGYLSFTLPVSTGKHLISKILTSYVWVMASITVLIGSIIMVVSDGGTFGKIFEVIKELIKETNKQNLWGLAIMIIFICLFTIYNYITMAYACLSIGQASSKHKLGGAVLAFVIIYMINQVIGFIFIGVSMGIAGNAMLEMNSISDMYPYIIYSLVLGIVQAIAYTGISQYMLSKKLNLE